MKVRSIPANTLTATVTLLRPYCGELTETKLVAALRSADANAAPETPNPMLLVREAAAILRVSPWTVVRMLRAGSLRGQKIGQQWRVSAEHVGELTNGKENPGDA